MNFLFDDRLQLPLFVAIVACAGFTVLCLINPGYVRRQVIRAAQAVSFASLIIYVIASGYAGDKVFAPVLQAAWSLKPEEARLLGGTIGAILGFLSGAFVLSFQFLLIDIAENTRPVLERITRGAEREPEDNQQRPWRL